MNEMNFPNVRFTTEDRICDASQYRESLSHSHLAWEAKESKKRKVKTGRQRIGGEWQVFGVLVNLLVSGSGGISLGSERDVE